MWNVHVRTESCDDYYFIYKNKPTRDAIVTKVWKYEGEDGDKELYNELLSITYTKCKVE